VVDGVIGTVETDSTDGAVRPERAPLRRGWDPRRTPGGVSWSTRLVVSGGSRFIVDSLPARSRACAATSLGAASKRVQIGYVLRSARRAAAQRPDARAGTTGLWERLFLPGRRV